MNVRSLLLLVGALALFAPTAFAQNEEQKAGARAAADEGGKAFEAGKFSESLDLFTRAESLVHALPHLLYIARSHEKLGHLVKARETYLKMTREKLADGAPDAFKDAQTKAQTELQSLEPRIPKVTIVVKGEGAASAKVQMDGTDVPAALVGIPHPVDPGQHKFVASGEGVKSEEKSADIKEGGSETIELELKPSGDSAAGSGAGGSGEGSATLDPASATKGSSGLRIASYAALGVGVVGLVAGTVFALSSKSKRDDASALCNNPDGSCPVEKRDEINKLDDDADQAKTFATVGFVVGGVGIAAGVTMFILSGKKTESHAASKPHVTPWVGLGSAGLSGRF